MNTKSQYKDASYCADGCVWNEDEVRIVGTNNVVNGDRCTVVGERNVVNGDKCIVLGDRNVINGDKCDIEGEGCVVNGDDCRLKADECTINGDNCDRRAPFVRIKRARFDREDISHRGDAPRRPSPQDALPGHQALPPHRIGRTVQLGGSTFNFFGSAPRVSGAPAFFSDMDIIGEAASEDGGASPPPAPAEPVDPYAAIKALAPTPVTKDSVLVCMICEENEANVMYQCGHFHCPQCARKMAECPFCREPVRNCTRAFPQ